MGANIKIPIVSLFFIPIITSAAFASSFKVRDGKHLIHLNVTNTTISYRDKDYSQTITREKCNQSVFDSFKNRVYDQSKELILINGNIAELEQSGPLIVTVEKTEKLAMKHTKSGQFFKRLPSNVRKLHLTSERVCNK